MVDVTNATKRAIIQDNLKALAQAQFDASVAKMVAEKCGLAKEMTAAIERMTAIEKKIAAYTEILDTYPEEK